MCPCYLFSFRYSPHPVTKSHGHYNYIPNGLISIHIETFVEPFKSEMKYWITEDTLPGYLLELAYTLISLQLERCPILDCITLIYKCKSTYSSGYHWPTMTTYWAILNPWWAVPPSNPHAMNGIGPKCPTKDSNQPGWLASYFGLMRSSSSSAQLSHELSSR